MCRPSYLGFRDISRGSGQKNAHPFCKTATGETPVAAFAKLVLLAAKSEVFNQLEVVRIALALDVIKEFAALGNHFQESAAGGEILLVNEEMIGEFKDPLGKQCDLVRCAAGVFFVDLIRLEVDFFFFCFYAHVDKGWAQRLSPSRPRGRNEAGKRGICKDFPRVENPLIPVCVTICKISAQSDMPQAIGTVV